MRGKCLHSKDSNRTSRKSSGPRTRGVKGGQGGREEVNSHYILYVKKKKHNNRKSNFKYFLKKNKKKIVPLFTSLYRDSKIIAISFVFDKLTTCSHLACA